MGEQQGKAHSNRIPLRGYGGPRTATTPFAASHAHRRVPLSMLDKVLRVVFFFRNTIRDANIRIHTCIFTYTNICIQFYERKIEITNIKIKEGTINISLY